MNKFIKTIFMFSIFLLFSNNTFAEGLWLNGNTNSRHFISLETEDNQIQVKIFYQVKGDYQDKISAYTFKTTSDAKDFIRNNFPNFSLVSELESWPVDTSVGDKRKNSEIWSANNRWNDEWEKKYADWLTSEVTEDFYIKHNIPTDCADAVIGYRWIFARINSLPAANTLSNTGSLFGHFSMRNPWRRLPTSKNWYQDQLFLVALNYVMDMTSTRTIMNTDGFPVSITKKGLQAGSFIVSYIEGSGHLRTVIENHYDNPNSLPIFTYSSTSPREVRQLYREAFIDQALPIKKSREIMAFRWPIVSRFSWILKQKESDSRYSQEQFDLSLQGQYYSFVQFVLSRVQPNYNPESLVTTGILDIVNYTKSRIKIVQDGYEYCRSHNCQKGTQGWEDWSTPSRDAKYLIKFNEVEDLVKTFDPMYPGINTKWQEDLDSTIVDIEGYPLSLIQLRSLFENKLISSNPNDSILRRWGL